MGENHSFCSQKLSKSKNVIHYSVLPNILRYQSLIRVLIYVTLSQKEPLFQWAHRGGTGGADYYFERVSVSRGESVRRRGVFEQPSDGLRRGYPLCGCRAGHPLCGHPAGYR